MASSHIFLKYLAAHLTTPTTPPHIAAMGDLRDIMTTAATADAKRAAAAALAIAVAAITATGDQQPHLLFRMPIKPGTYPLDGDTNITVLHGNDQIFTRNGTLVVYAVTATAIAFGLTIRGLDDTVINGRMTADVSPIVDGITWPTPPAGK